MRKLKSIKQILEENPDARFDSDGNLFNSFWNSFVSPERFYLFGSRIDSEVFNDYKWDESWFEEPPKPKVKKLYAYTQGTFKGVRKIEWFDNEITEDTFYIREPDFDKSFEVRE